MPDSIKYIDAHAHLNSPQFAGEEDDILARSLEAGVLPITIGADWESSRLAVALARKYSGRTFATVGIHPTDSLAEIDWVEFEKLAGEKEVVAIGECGLDFYRFEGDLAREKIRQAELFERQIDLAVKLGKPLVIHIREAYEEAYEILKRKKAEVGDKLSADLHFFSGTPDWVEKFSALDFYFSFAGPITFTDQYDEAVKHVPADRLMAETDSPFAAPAPYRGKRNEPAYVKYVAEKILALRGWGEEEGLARLKNNTIKFYNLPIQ
jgi:TatD DNase family protein